MKRAIFTRSFKGTHIDLLIKPAIEKRIGNGLDEVNAMAKQFINTKHSSTTLTSEEASSQKNERIANRKFSKKGRKKENRSVVSIWRIS